MIKRIIFDVDNTLIMWQDKFLFALRNVLDEELPNYTEEDVQNIDSCIPTYEKTHDKYTKEDFLNHVNNNSNLNLKIEFVDKLIIAQGNCYEEDEKLVDTIKYLANKYDLVVLSNWITETQKLRLKGLGILKYFTLVSGGDERVLKPNKEAFDVVIEGYNKEECLMVGDSLEHDIIPAIELGIPCIWITKEESDIYQTAKNVYELKEML